MDPSQAIEHFFNVDSMAAVRMAALKVLEIRILDSTDEELRLLNRWVGSVFAIAEHERRRRWKAV